MNLLKKNLNNVEVELDLLGTKVEKLSMLDRIGFVPLSVWQPDWERTKILKGIVGDKGDTRKLVSGATTFGADVGASIFNPDLAQKILSAYCPQNAKILDQFGGGGTRGFIASAMGFDYTGIELRQEEVTRIKKQMKVLGKQFTLHCGDSVNFKLPKAAFDFSLTCPPYFDLEVYSKNNADLSNLSSYEKFLDLLKIVVAKNYEALKPNALSVWVVGNFRDKAGNLRHFNGDLVRLASWAGFHLLDELIWWGASGSAAQRCGNFEKNRKSVRVHEYILVFKKAEK